MRHSGRLGAYLGANFCSTPGDLLSIHQLGSHPVHMGSRVQSPHHAKPQFGGRNRPESHRSGTASGRVKRGSPRPTFYVGEVDPARPWLEQHFVRKDFWTSLILFTSKDENLNKAHVQYLEARFARSSSLTMFWINLLPDVEFPEVVKLLKDRLG